MEGNLWYQGWVRTSQMRLALARHELGKVAELAPPQLDWEWEPPSTFLDALAALGDRERIEARSAEVATTGNVRRAISRFARLALPVAIGAPPAGAQAIRGNGALLARGAAQAPAVRRCCRDSRGAVQCKRQAHRLPPATSLMPMRVT